MITRRKFLRTTLRAAAITPPLSGLYAWRIEPHWLEVTHRSLPLHGLPDLLEGRSLVHLSDLHVGKQVDDSFILDTFLLVTTLKPDIVVYTGDFITYDGPEQLSQLDRLLDHVPYGALGTFAILGNHDYGFGWSMFDVANRVADQLTAAHVSVLRNDVGNGASGLAATPCVAPNTARPHWGLEQHRSAGVVIGRPFYAVLANLAQSGAHVRRACGTAGMMPIKQPSTNRRVAPS